MSLITEGARAGLIVSDARRESAVMMDALPRFGLYAPWSGLKNEGWMRYTLDTFQIPYVRVRNEMLRAGNLGSFLDVLIIPSIGPSQLDEGRAPGSIPERKREGRTHGPVDINRAHRRGNPAPGECEIAADLLQDARFFADDAELQIEMGAIGGAGLGHEAITAEIGDVLDGDIWAS